jgi:bifunctional non-homologous end joining protein LigD
VRIGRGIRAAKKFKGVRRKKAEWPLTATVSRRWRDAWHIGAGSAIIDGEIVVTAENGTTDFSVLRKELKGRSRKIVLVAFDLLYLEGRDLRKLPLVERKALLKKIIADTEVQFTDNK